MTCRRPIPVRVTTCLLAVILTLSLFSGCSDKTAGQLFKYDIDSDPQNLDPQLANDYPSQLVIENTMEGLLRLKPDGKLTEGVATDYTVSEDGKTYQFTLRPDAKWQNGDPVTAKDFVFGFQRLFKPETNSPAAENFYCIKNSKTIRDGKMSVRKLGVTAQDDTHLTIELDYPNSMFLTLLTTAAAMPCNESFFYATKGKYGLEAENTLSNGPYYLKAWGHDDYLSCRLNTHYQSAAQPIASGVSFLVIKEREEQLDRFQKEQSSALVLYGDEINDFSGDDYHREEYENTVWGIVFNQKAPVFSNKNFRLALSYAFQPQSYQEHLPAGFSATRSIVPKGITLLDRSYRDYAGDDILPAFDPSRARQYLDQAKKELQRDHFNGLELIAPEGVHLGLFSYASQIWQKELGIYLAVKALPADEFQAAVDRGEYQCAIVSLSADYNSPASVLSAFVGGSADNISGYRSDQFDSLLAGASQKVSLDETAQEYKKAEQCLMNDGVFLPLYQQKDYFTYPSSTSGMQYHSATKLITFSQGRKKG